jgi:hypothetical protein
MASTFTFKLAALSNTSLQTIRSHFTDNVFPSKSTPTGRRLNDILSPYLASLESWKADDQDPNTKPKPIVLMVITDGEPDSKQEVKDTLVESARKLDRGKWPPWYVGVQFVQVSSATTFTDSLEGNKQIRLAKMRRRLHS